MRMERKHVVVTGASSGIGRALALALAEKGAALTIAARREERLAEVVGEIETRFPEAPPAFAVRCDVSDEQQVRWLIGGAIERAGAVDILINNAGISVFGEAARTSLDDVRDVMSVNFYGALYCMREVLPFMMARESGLIVNVSTVAALHGVPYLAAYGASKAALGAFSESLRAELHETGVRVMLVYPGYTDTEIYDAEKKVGGARRPPGSYAPADRVAGKIVRAIERGGHDFVLTVQGQALSALRGLAPPIVESAMRRIARELREEGES